MGKAKIISYASTFVVVVRNSSEFATFLIHESIMSPRFRNRDQNITLNRMQQYKLYPAETSCKKHFFNAVKQSYSEIFGITALDLSSQLCFSPFVTRVNFYFYLSLKIVPRLQIATYPNVFPNAFMNTGSLNPAFVRHMQRNIPGVQNLLTYVAFKSRPL